MVEAAGVGESATVGAPPAIANAVVDALAHLGVRHLDIPITPDKVWGILSEKGVAELLASCSDLPEQQSCGPGMEASRR